MSTKKKTTRKTAKKKTAKAATSRRAPAKKKTSSTKGRGDSGARRASSRPRVGTVLVTGASGFLGRHVIDELVEAGVQVRALMRHPSLKVEKSGVEVILGDVCDPEVCDRALKGVSGVYHLAGFVSRRQEDATALYRVHVEGTRTLFESAAAAGVGRIVLASTSGTVGVSREEDVVSDETSPYPKATVAHWPYYLSKIYQEETALELAQRLGLEVVVVNPSLLLGPGDVGGSSTGDVEQVVRGRVPVIPSGGGIAFVDARDAARGCVLAMNQGTAGERYLLSAANMTLGAYLGRVARLAGVPSPRVIDAPRAMRAATRLAEALFERFNARPPIDEQSFEMAQHTWYVDASKARDQLGWVHRDPQDTLADTVRDIQARHGLRDDFR